MEELDYLDNMDIYDLRYLKNYLIDKCEKDSELLTLISSIIELKTFVSEYKIREKSENLYKVLMKYDLRRI